MKFTLLPLFLNVLRLCASQPIVHEKDTGVSYIGSVNDGVEEFLSIRYGLDTGGQHRFKPPRKYEAERGLEVDTTQEGPACPQPEHPMSGDPYSVVNNPSEDCLFLRVARPAGTKGHDKLPVMVWIYGGGHMVGNIYDVSYQPAGLVNNSVNSGNPVIYVAINHRVNVFGYPLSDAVLDGGDGTRANLGLRDQRLGMQWIKEHISAFGGDPDNITVFGEDAGASDIGLHIAGGHTPFRRAIAQSGSSLSPWAVRHDASRGHFAEVVARIGCVSGSPQFWYSLNCMRQFTMEQVLDVTFDLAWFIEPSNGFHVFGPAIDNDIVFDKTAPQHQNVLSTKTVDYMTGWNMDELSMDVPTSIQTISQAAAWIGQRYPQLIEPIALMVLYVYTEVDYARRSICPKEVSTAWCTLSRALRDIEVACPSLRQASDLYESSKGQSSVYLYELNQTAFAPTLEQNGKAYLGVTHFSDVPYVFNELQTAYYVSDPKEIKLAESISRGWASFATHGAPDEKWKWPQAVEDDVSAEANIESKRIAVEVLGGPSHGPREMVFKEKRRCQYIDSMVHFFTRA
ncbi:hypothetical protein PRZ48_008326 [Zasmidium cellare]|uniref:Carboxylesterase type B domain-containing protein n=1 Tax=Zasmidium cellare TaxID=395010 RepID=A0ABR0EFS7_ZASCE|nr:hypothetical protein PRZ48_008326 [Zasmidium cellare]